MTKKAEEEALSKRPDILKYQRAMEDRQAQRLADAIDTEERLRRPDE